jgi:quercetin dioxygenase-like cupin family protein
MPFSNRASTVGEIAGSDQGLQRLILRVQPVAPDDVGHLHRHDNADQILCVLQGEVLIEVDGDARVCQPGEMGLVPAGTSHGFLGLGAPALLEVFGEQRRGTVFLLDDGDEVEVHRPGVPWDRPGPPTDMSALTPRLLAPRRP